MADVASAVNGTARIDCATLLGPRTPDSHVLRSVDACLCTGDQATVLAATSGAALFAAAQRSTRSPGRKLEAAAFRGVAKGVGSQEVDCWQEICAGQAYGQGRRKVPVPQDRRNLVRIWSRTQLDRRRGEPGCIFGRQERSQCDRWQR